MAVELDGLKADLEKLNQSCQLARDNETFYVLQRSRLEAERALLLVRIVDVAAASKAAPDVAIPVVTAPPLSPVSGAAVNGAVVNGAVLHRNSKPPGLPSIAKMVVAALEDAAKHGQAGLKSGEITAAVRKVWPEARGVVVSSSAWHLAKTGKLEKVGALYKLNGHAP